MRIKSYLINRLYGILEGIGFTIAAIVMLYYLAKNCEDPQFISEAQEAGEE